MTDTFPSGTPSSATMSFFEHSEDVMIARENLAQPFSRTRCIVPTFFECDGMVIGVTSWMVQTAGTGLMGSVAAVGTKITSARERAADQPAPPNLHTRS